MKFFYLIASMLLLLLSTNFTTLAQEYQGQDQVETKVKKVVKNKFLKNGFNIDFNITFPNSDYMRSYDYYNFRMSNYDSWSNNLMFGVQVGNNWYLLRGNKMGLAINVNWFDINYGEIDTYINGNQEGYDILDMSFLKLGPKFTFQVLKNLGVNVYYNIRPTLIMLEANYIDDEMMAGLNHSVGLSFRSGLLSLGVEANFGNVTIDGDNDFTTLGLTDLDTSTMKVQLGFFL